MTERGTFVVNGVERVVVSQLIRSPGAFFTARLGGEKIISVQKLFQTEELGLNLKQKSLDLLE